MARVLIFANDNSTIYNFRRELLGQLVTDGDEVFLVLPSHERNVVFREMGCKVQEIPFSRFGTNPVREFMSLVRYAKTIRSISPDVVLTYTAKPNIYGGLAAQVCRVPYISTVTGLGSAFQSDGLLQRLSAQLQRFAFRRARRVFFQNSENLAVFQHLGIVRDQVAVLPGSGVNLDLHQLEPYCSDEPATRFITVSRIRRDKGFDELFEMIREVSTKRSDVEFHIVGWYEDDSYRAPVEAIQTEYPVTVHGSVSQERVHELIAGCHALIHPSHHEGMANVVLEASAAGVPCLASDIPGCREAIRDGESGLLFQVNDTDALVEAVERFLALSWVQRHEMGLTAHQKMVAEFDRQAVVQRYVEEIRNLTVDSSTEVGV